MKVYRYLSQNELNSILENNISAIGCKYSPNEEYKRINNHKYKTDVKYLHFFKHKKDCDRVKFISKGKDIEFYIVEFNIPITTLIQHIGCGYYNAHGYNVNLEKAIEFAIPTSKFKSEYLLSYVRDEVHHHSLEQKKNFDEMLYRCKDIFKNSNLPELQKKPKIEAQTSDEESASQPSQQ